MRRGGLFVKGNQVSYILVFVDTADEESAFLKFVILLIEFKQAERKLRCAVLDY